METDFILIRRRPTPDELLKAVIQIVPEFATHWEAPDNYFRNDDGSFSLHAVILELMNYVKNAFRNLDYNQRRSLAELFQKHAEIEMRLYLKTKSKEYFNIWN